MNTIRILLSLVANNNRDLHQFNVKNAILNGNMKEDIYMEVPPRVGSGPAPKKVCKMKKVLYGLKRSPRVWFERFAKISKSTDHLWLITWQGQSMKLVTNTIVIPNIILRLRRDYKRNYGPPSKENRSKKQNDSPDWIWKK